MDADSGCLFAMAVVGLPPMLVLLTTLAPDYVQRARAAMRGRPGRSFLLGLVNFAFFAALSLLTRVDFAPAAFIGTASLVFVLPLFLLAGMLVAAGFVGERVWMQLSSQEGTEPTSPRSRLWALLVGILVMGLAVLVPIFGWLLFLGLVLAGLGAAIVTLFQRRRPEPELAPLSTVPEERHA